MADDLDDFFNEVSAAEEEAKKEASADTNETNKDDKTEEKISKNETDAKEKEDGSRPSKRQKVVVAAAPKKVVVASSATVVSAAPSIPAPATSITNKTKETIESIGAVAPPPPPPPPPPPLPPGPPPTQPSIGPLYPTPYNTTTTGDNNTSIPPPPPPPSQNQKPHKRSAAGETWEDPTLTQWPENDFRLFVGNLAKDIKLPQLEQAFASKYPSFAMAKICVNKHDGKSRGYGFVSLLDPKDCARAIREMDQSWLGSRPIKVKRSDWKDRELNVVRKKVRKEKRRGNRGFGI